jgi:hypothetical protein
MDLGKIRRLALEILRECDNIEKPRDTRNLKQRQEDNTHRTINNKKKIIADYKKGTTLKSIAEKYSITNPNVVSFFLDKWGIRKRKYR